jgi:hypothetical protein
VTSHPLDAAAIAAYGAFALSSAGRPGEMPPWDALPPEARADWRAVADAVQMFAEMRDGAARPGPPAQVTGDVKGKLDDAFQFTERGGSRHSYVSREWVETLLAHHAAAAVTAERERCIEVVLREAGIYEGDAAAILYDIADVLRQDQP